MDSENQDVPIAIPITGVLDLHTFHPREVSAVISAYFEACRERGLRTVRLIHGKGQGTLRQGVHALLRKSTEVESFSIADAADGGWGATWVRLRD